MVFVAREVPHAVFLRMKQRLTEPPPRPRGWFNWKWSNRHARHCAGQPVRRFNSRTGELFYGCSRFPACRFTLPREDP